MKNQKAVKQLTKALSRIQSCWIKDSSSMRVHSANSVRTGYCLSGAMSDPTTAQGFWFLDRALAAKHPPFAGRVVAFNDFQDTTRAQVVEVLKHAIQLARGA